VKLLTPELRAEFARIGKTQDADDPLVVAKFRCPGTGWTWYAIEFDGDDTFWGFVSGFADEFGDFSLTELEALTGAGEVERVEDWKPRAISSVLGRELR